MFYHPSCLGIVDYIHWQKNQRPYEMGDNINTKIKKKGNIYIDTSWTVHQYVSSAFSLSVYWWKTFGEIYIKPQLNKEILNQQT